LDVSAVALAALHLGAGREPATQKFLSGRLAELGPRELAVRRRWARALAEIAQRWRRAGRVEPAALAWERFQEIRPGGQPRIGRQGLTEPRQ
jgi:predicted TPR repeat methyltransferase